MEHAQIIQDTLRKLGVGKNYISQKRTVVAIQLALEDEDRLLRVKKGIYIPAAEQCNCPSSRNCGRGIILCLNHLCVIW